MCARLRLCLHLRLRQRLRVRACVRLLTRERVFVSSRAYAFLHVRVPVHVTSLATREGGPSPHRSAARSARAAAQPRVKSTPAKAPGDAVLPRNGPSPRCTQRMICTQGSGPRRDMHEVSIKSSLEAPALKRTCETIEILKISGRLQSTTLLFLFLPAAPSSRKGLHGVSQ